MRQCRGVRVVAFVALVGAVTLLGPAEISSGQSLASPLTVVKVVSGSAPAGTVFTVTISCDAPLIAPLPGTSQATMTFNATGQPQGTNTIGFLDATTCTVTETVTGGAASVQYSCTSTFPSAGPSGKGFPGAAASGSTTTTSSGHGLTSQAAPVCADGPQTTPMVVHLIEETQTATVTVTNTFPPPPPVIVAPKFTG